MSTDPVDSHKKFCQSLDLPFPLLSDGDGAASKLYGIVIARGKDVLSGRSVFLVKKDGTVAFADADYKLNPADDYNALAKAIETLGGAKPEPEKKPEGKKT